MATKSTEVTERRSGDVQPQAQRASEVGAPRQAALRPAVDIFEDNEGITLCADMPGVSKERLNVRVDRDSLVIEGEIEIELPAGMDALHAEVRSTHYQRRFALSDELEADKIDAKLKDGVLTVRIPKRAELRPRRIEVKAD
jgi:HSP20 family protein